MNGSRLRTMLLSASLVVLVAAANLATVSAATPAAAVPKTGVGNGLRIETLRSDLTINPGNEKTVDIKLSNITSQDAYFQVVINDFTASPDESGNPSIVFDTSKPVTAHSLRQFIQPVQPFLLHAGEQKSLTVTVKVPKNAVAGGYYGVIRFAPTSADGNSPTGSKNISLAGSVGSLVLLKVPGNIKEQLNIASFDVRRNDVASSFFTNKKGLNVVVRFQNLGGIQDQPFGKILVIDRHGKEIASYEVNGTQPPASVLPDSIRKFSIPLTHLNNFGKYKLEGNFGYGSNGQNVGQLLSASTTIYIVPVFLIALFVGIVALLLFVVFVLPRLIAGYNRRIVDQSKRGRRY